MIKAVTQTIPQIPYISLRSAMLYALALGEISDAVATSTEAECMHIARQDRVILGQYFQQIVVFDNKRSFAGCLQLLGQCPYCYFNFVAAKDCCLGLTYVACVLGFTCEFFKFLA